MKGKLAILTLTMIVQLSLSHYSLASETSYTWAVVPQFTGTAVHRDWTPVIKYVEDKTGFHFNLKIYDSIPDFEKAFLKGEPDFAYMNPYHAVMAMDAQGYEPIIRNLKRSLTGIIVIRADSDVENIKQLNGKTISFPSPNAFAASLYMRALLIEKEHITFTPVYAGTHSNAYRQVLLGKADAAGAVKRTLKKERKEVQQNLKIIYQTPAFPSHPLTVHKRVPDNVKQAVQSAMIKLNLTEQGKQLLKAILLSNPVKATYDMDYLPLKALNLNKYLKER